MQDALRRPAPSKAAAPAGTSQPSVAVMPADRQRPAHTVAHPDGGLPGPHAGDASKRSASHHAGGAPPVARHSDSARQPVPQVSKPQPALTGRPATAEPPPTGRTSSGQRAAFTPLQPSSVGRGGPGGPGCAARATKPSKGPAPPSFFSAAPRRPGQPPGPDRPACQPHAAAPRAPPSQAGPGPQSGASARLMTHSTRSAPSDLAGDTHRATSAARSMHALPEAGKSVAVRRAGGSAGGAAAPARGAVPAAAPAAGGRGVCRKCGGEIPRGGGGGAAQCGHLVCGDCWVAARLKCQGQGTVCPVCGAAMRARSAAAAL